MKIKFKIKQNKMKMKLEKKRKSCLKKKESKKDKIKKIDRHLFGREKIAHLKKKGLKLFKRILQCLMLMVCSLGYERICVGIYEREHA